MAQESIQRFLKRYYRHGNEDARPHWEGFICEPERLASHSGTRVAVIIDEFKDMKFYLFTGCISGASSITDIEKMLKDAGFDEIEIKPKDESRDFIQNWVPDSKIEDYIVSATIEAIKPR